MKRLGSWLTTARSRSCPRRTDLGPTNLSRTFGELELTPVTAAGHGTVPAQTVFKITIHYETMKHDQRVSATLNPDASSAREAKTYFINHDPIAYRFGVGP